MGREGVSKQEGKKAEEEGPGAEAAKGLVPDGSQASRSRAAGGAVFSGSGRSGDWNHCPPLGVGVVRCHPSGPELRGSDCGPHPHLPEQVSRSGRGDEPVCVAASSSLAPSVPRRGPLRSRAGCRSNLELGSCSATC